MGHHVVGADVFVETLTDAAQQLIAGLLAKGVVDVLETIEVEPDQGELTLACLGTREGLREHHRQHRAVGQLGYGVHEGEPLDELVSTALVGDVGDDQHAALHRACLVAHRQGGHAMEGFTRAKLGRQRALRIDRFAGQRASEVVMELRREDLKQ